MASQTSTSTSIYSSIPKDVIWYISCTNMAQPPQQQSRVPPPPPARETAPSANRRPPALPLELLLEAAQYLVPPCTRSKSFPATFDSARPLSQCHQDREDYLAVLRLSSLSVSLRRLLAPLVWQDVLIHRPDRLGKLRSIMDYYQRLASSASEIDRLVYPLPLVRTLRVLLPDRYLSLDQEILRHLIRSGMNPSNHLHTLEWDAEVLPGPMIWRLLGSEKMEGLEDLLTQRKGHTLSREQIREIAYSGSAKALYNPRDGRIRMADEERHQLEKGIRSMSVSPARSPSSRDTATDALHDQYSGHGAHFGQQSFFGRGRRLQTDEDGDSEDGYSSQELSPARYHPPGLESLSLHCRIFYPGNIDMSRLRSLRHLRLTSFDSHLLPPHLPSLLLSLYEPLRSISLSTSKTSLLHDVDLIQRGCFSRLEDLDIYPVTPEWPLCQGLRSAGATLKRLRLILDVSGSFSNFDNLFRNLSQPWDQDFDAGLDLDGEQERDQKRYPHHDHSSHAGGSRRTRSTTTSRSPSSSARSVSASSRANEAILAATAAAAAAAQTQYASSISSSSSGNSYPQISASEQVMLSTQAAAAAAVAEAEAEQAYEVEGGAGLQAETSAHSSSYDASSSAAIPIQFATVPSDDAWSATTSAYRRIEGSLPYLKSLYLDPFPQENTAPSFRRFLRTCPRLKWINGRPVEEFDIWSSEGE